MLLVRTKLHETTKRGIGLFAAQYIKEGTIVHATESKYNKIFTEEDIKEVGIIEKEFIDTYFVKHKNGTYLLDLDNSRFMNHSIKPNISCNDNYCIAIKDIKIDEEILCNYQEFDELSKQDLGFKVEE